MPCNCGESNCSCSGKCNCSEKFCMCIECIHIKEVSDNQFEVITIASSPSVSITTINLDDVPDNNIYAEVGELCIEMLDSPHQELETDVDVCSISSDKIKQEDGKLSTVQDKTKQEDESPGSSTVTLQEMSSSESECEILIEKQGLKEETSETGKPDTKQEDCINREPDNNNIVYDIPKEDNLISCSNELNSQNKKYGMSGNRRQFFKRGFRHATRSISPWVQRSYSFSGQYNQHRVPYNDEARTNRNKNISIPPTSTRYLHRNTQSTSVYDFTENECLRSPPILNHLCLSTSPQTSTQTHSAASYRRGRPSFQNHNFHNPNTTITRRVDFSMPEGGTNCHQFTLSQSTFRTECHNGYEMTNERNRPIINCHAWRQRRAGPPRNNPLQNNRAGTVEQPRHRKRRQRRRASRKMGNGTSKKEVKNNCSIKKENDCTEKLIKKEDVCINKEIKQETCFIKKEIKEEKP